MILSAVERPAREEVEVSKGAVSARGRLLLLFAALATLAAFAKPNPLSLVAGGLLLVAGEALRIWAAGHLHKTERLITSGPYCWVRHPMYLGRLLLLSGVGVAAWLPHYLSLAVLAGGYALFFAYYLPRKERVEGARLALQHGVNYEAYREAVPALFPGRSSWKSGAEPWRKERFMRNREGLTSLVLLAYFLLLALR